MEEDVIESDDAMDEDLLTKGGCNDALPAKESVVEEVNFDEDEDDDDEVNFGIIDLDIVNDDLAFGFKVDDDDSDEDDETEDDDENDEDDNDGIFGAVAVGDFSFFCISISFMPTIASTVRALTKGSRGSKNSTPPVDGSKLTCRQRRSGDNARIRAI